MAGPFMRLADRRRATFYFLSRGKEIPDGTWQVAGEQDIERMMADVPRVYCTSCGEAWEDGHVDRCPPRTQPSR